MHLIISPFFFLLCLEYFPRRELIARDICALHFRGCFSRLSDHALCIRTRMVLEHSKYDDRGDIPLKKTIQNDWGINGLDW